MFWLAAGVLASCRGHLTSPAAHSRLSADVPLLRAMLHVQIISAHPALLSYSVPDRLQPFFAYLTGELGLSQQVQAVG